MSDSEILSEGSSSTANQLQKTWDECSSDEKLEVLRDVLRSKDMEIQDLRTQVSRLMNHSHGRDGELLGPIYPYAGMGCSSRHYDPLA